MPSYILNWNQRNFRTKLRLQSVNSIIRVHLSFIIKATPGEQPFVWKWKDFCINGCIPGFDKETHWNSDNDYFYSDLPRGMVFNSLFRFDRMTKPWRHTVNIRVQIPHKTHSLHEDDSLLRGTTEESRLIFKKTLSQCMFYGHHWTQPAIITIFQS